MKMKPEDYSRLETAISKVLSSHDATLQDYLDAGLTPKRFRWDALWRAVRLNWFDFGQMYDYLNDTHIDTALRKITRTT